MLKYTEHYFFAHKALPLLLFNRDELFISSFIHSKERFADLLNIVWKNEREYRDLISGTKTDIESPEFKVFLENLKDNLYLVIIMLPNPKNPAEAIAVGFTFSTDKNVQSRYFTYELDFDAKNNTPVFYVCEWNRNRMHVNYGHSSSSNLSFFIDKIREITLNEK